MFHIFGDRKIYMWYPSHRGDKPLCPLCRGRTSLPNYTYSLASGRTCGIILTIRFEGTMPECASHRAQQSQGINKFQPLKLDMSLFGHRVYDNIGLSFCATG